MAAIALEIQHGIDHVFQHPRAGDLAVLGDMAHQEQYEAAMLGQPDQLGRTGPHLTDGAGRRFDIVGIDGLDGIDHHHLGRVGTVQRGQDVAQGCGRGQSDPGLGVAQADGAHAHLIHRLLARDIGDVGLGRQGGCGLQQQGGLADARIAAHQQARARHQPAAADPVQFADAGQHAGQGGRTAFETDELDLAALAAGQALGDFLAAGLLHDGVPGAARLALAGPLEGDGAAVLADELGGGFGQDYSAAAGGRPR